MANLRLLIRIAILCTPLIAQPLRAQKADQLYTATRNQLDVTKVVIAQQRAWNNGDLDAYLDRYKDAADTQAVLATLVRGAPAIRMAFHTNFPSRDAMGSLEETDIDVRELGDTFALATGKYHITRSKKSGGDADGSFTDLLEKTPSGWKIIYSANT